eukprot:TRINITY_DN6212_c0_g2_i1.p1 TRINITY_DN6212_c0_g2~~TRINITY_DN6212_c0_g2_i1.p1  ORF type:complete len:973 (+),score=112.61 TRINITY_DN6212_c0_g2_i1:37-2955(+)
MKQRVLLFSLTTWLAAGRDLGSLLASVQFLNEGTWRADNYTVIAHHNRGYLEPENVTRSEYAWALENNIPQVYSQKTHQCQPGKPLVNTDMPGMDLMQIPSVASTAACDAICCSNIDCSAWVFAEQAPANLGKCTAGSSCCYLKSGVPTAVPHQSVSSRVVRSEGTFEGADAHPPTGIRSAPPLGGLAAGTVELRADGTLTAWTMENNSPAGSVKVPKQKAAFFGARVSDGEQTWAKVLQTQPEDGLPGVSELQFGGSPPITRLTVMDESLPKGVSLSLFGYGRLTAGDMTTSHHPAVAFTMVFSNSGTRSVEVGAMFNLPTYHQNIGRNGTVLSSHPATTPKSCLESCSGEVTCGSWKISGGECILFTDMPFYEFEDQTVSGTAVSLRKETESPCVSFDKKGTSPMSGGYSLCGDGGSVSVSSGSDSWNDFHQSGYVSGSVAGVDDSIVASVNQTVAPGTNVTLTIVLGYFFPYHNYLNLTLGNQYVNNFASSKDAAMRMMSNLTTSIEDALAIQTPLQQSSLPQWMSDTLLSQLHHTRSAMWFKDGRWRQWEAYDCVNIDSVHNDGERHIPYIMLFPESTKSKMIGWGKAQNANGMINEQLVCGCTGGIDPVFEHGCGRKMSDVSSMYIVYLLELLRWNNDTDFVREWFQTAQRAAEWQISVSTYHGMPYRLQTTYDILGFNNYDTCTYSTVFHILAMRSMAELCLFMGNSSCADRYTAAGDLAREGLDRYLWNEELGAYNAYSSDGPNSTNTVMADSFYAQVLGYSLGLDSLVNETRLLRHLATEERTNSVKYGLRILSGRSQDTDTCIWMMSNGDHGALLLRHAKTLSDIDSALASTSTPFIRIRSGLKDVWNAAGILMGNEGKFPGSNYISSHYGYYMTLWHTMLSVTKQVVNLPEGKLIFNPPVDPVKTLKWPVFVPNVVGHIIVSPGRWTFCLTAGSLKNVSVSVSGKSSGKITLVAPDCHSESF